MKENDYVSREEFEAAMRDMERQYDLTLSAQFLMNQQKEKHRRNNCAQKDTSLGRRRYVGTMPAHHLSQQDAGSEGKVVKKKNGFLLGEALIALLICSISGFLVLMSSSALAKAMSMDIQTEMNLDTDLSVTSDQ
ncbi:MAG: hypothetical protein ACI32F_03285 [Allobaculum sp.]